MKLATTVARWTSRAHTKRPKYNFISSLLNPYCTNYAQFRRFYSIEDNVGNCWKCSNKQPSNSLFCQNSNCAVVNRLTIADDSNLFDLFGLESKFDIDASYLDAQYRNLQTQLHPDRFATKSSAEKEASSESSSTINRAYQVSTVIPFVMRLLKININLFRF